MVGHIRVMPKWLGQNGLFTIFQIINNKYINHVLTNILITL